MVGWLFPGQGSQKVGMGLDLKENSEKAKMYFDKSNEIMDYDIQSIIFNGPEDELKKTEYTQPAIYIVSVIMGYLLIDKGLKPTALAGHSLGEYSALTTSNALDFKSAIKLLNERGKAMQDAVPDGHGAMLAILGMKIEEVENEINVLKKNGVCEIANDNTNGQVVVSGTKKNIEMLN